MTYRFKLSRRMALSRVGGLLVCLALQTACSTDSQENSDPSQPAAVSSGGKLMIGPKKVIGEIGQPIQLTARRTSWAYPRRDDPVVPVDWIASGGTITSDGLFSADQVGTFKVVGKARGRHKSDTSTVVIVPTPPTLVAILVSPATVKLASQATGTFTAMGILSDSSQADVGVTWSATGGSIDAGGVYLAGTASGHFKAIAKSVSSGKSDTADIVIDSTVTPAPTLEALRLTPDSATVLSGQSLQFVAKGQMSDGSTSAARASFTATGGAIDSTGRYSAGSTPGTFWVRASIDGLADTALVTIPAPASTCVGTATRLCPGDNLQAKATAAGSGATLRLQSGVYRLQSVSPLSGQTWVGDAGAIISGARVLTGWQSDGAGHWYVGGQTQQNTSYNVNYSCQAGHDGCFYPEQLWVDGVLYEHMTTLGAAGSGKWYFDYGADRIYVGGDPTGHTVETSVAVYAFGGSASGVTIKHLTIEKYANAAQRAAVNYTSAPGWTIDSNEVRFNHGIGISIASNGIMRGNYVHHQGQMGITAKGSNGLVQGNEIAYNNTAYFGGGHYAEAGGSKFVATSGLIVRGNFSHHNHGPGLWTDINNINCLYENNVVEDNDWRGIFHEISYACVIRNNVARRNGFNSVDPFPLDGAGIVISNSPDVEVYGNTVEDNRAGIVGLESDRESSHPSGYGPHNLTNLYVHDNTVKQTDGGRAGGIADTDPNWNPYAGANNRWARNTYVVGTGTDWRWAPNVDVSRPEWLAAGQDSGAVFK